MAISRRCTAVAVSRIVKCGDSKLKPFFQHCKRESLGFLRIYIVDRPKKARTPVDWHFPDSG